MARYKLGLKNGVVDTENNKCIPECENNRDWKAYQKWASDGNVPDEAETEEEKKERLLDVLRGERNRLLKESDIFELTSYQKMYNILQEDVETYKQLLRDMPDTHTTINQLEKPTWPEKPSGS